MHEKDKKKIGDIVEIGGEEYKVVHISRGYKAQRTRGGQRIVPDSVGLRKIRKPKKWTLEEAQAAARKFMKQWR